LLVWTFAIAPSRLLTYLDTKSGQDKVIKLLEEDGDDILAAGRKRLKETRWMQRKLKKLEARRNTKNGRGVAA
jgi:hypothetical protein